jgi:hypothetical protein
MTKHNDGEVNSQKLKKKEKWKEGGKEGREGGK